MNRSKMIILILLLIIFLYGCNIKEIEMTKETTCDYDFTMYQGQTIEINLSYPNIYEECEFEDEMLDLDRVEGTNIDSINVALINKYLCNITYIKASDQIVQINSFIFNVKDSKKQYLLNVDIQIKNSSEYNGYLPNFPKEDETQPDNLKTAGITWRDNNPEYFTVFSPESLGLTDIETMSFELINIEYPSNKYLDFNIKYSLRKTEHDIYYEMDDLKDLELPLIIDKDTNPYGFVVYLKIVGNDTGIPYIPFGFSIKYQIKYNGDDYTIYQDFKTYSSLWLND